MLRAVRVSIRGSASIIKPHTTPNHATPTQKKAKYAPDVRGMEVENACGVVLGSMIF